MNILFFLGKNRIKNLVVNGTLKVVFKKQGMRVWIGLIGLRNSPSGVR
jgi:hypothetical protein